MSSKKGTTKLTLPPPEQVGHAEIWHHPNETRTIKISTRFSYFIWAGVPMDADSSISWLAFLRSITRELVLDWGYYVALVVFASLLAAGGAINSMLAGLIYGIFSLVLTLAFMSFRHTRSLPTNLNFAYTTAELPHYRQGLVVFLTYGAVMTAAALLAWPTIIGLVTTPIAPNWTAGPAGPFSTGGAIIYLIIVAMFLILSAQHNFPLDLHSYYYKSEANNMLNFTRVNMIVSLVDSAIKMLGWQYGLWLVNPFAYVSACLAAGTCTVNGSFGWGVHFFMPMVGGLVAWAIHLWTYNQNGLPEEVFQEAAMKQKAAQQNQMDGALLEKTRRL